jgi:hypothetical protein
MKFRKIMACVLAVAMIASLASVASGFSKTGEFPRWTIDTRIDQYFDVTLSGRLETLMTLGIEGIVYLPGLYNGATVYLDPIRWNGDSDFEDDMEAEVIRVTVAGNRGASVLGNSNPTAAPFAGANGLIASNELINAIGTGAGTFAVRFNSYYVCTVGTCEGGGAPVNESDGTPANGSATNCARATTSGQGGCGGFAATGPAIQGRAVLEPQGGPDLGAGLLFQARNSPGTNQIRYGSLNNLQISITLRFDADLLGDYNDIRRNLGEEERYEFVRLLDANENEMEVHINPGFNANTGSGANSTTDNDGQWALSLDNTLFQLKTLGAGSMTRSGSAGVLNLTGGDRNGPGGWDVFTTAEMRQISEVMVKGGALAFTADTNYQHPLSATRIRVSKNFGADVWIGGHLIDTDFSGRDEWRFVIPGDTVMDPVFDWNVRRVGLQFWFNQNPGWGNWTWEPSNWQFGWVDVANALGEIEINSWTIEVLDPDHGVEIKGDLNRDGRVTPVDALIALRFATSGGYTADDLLIGDMNNDGKFTPADALAILRIANGLNTAEAA